MTSRLGRKPAGRACGTKLSIKVGAGLLGSVIFLLFSGSAWGHEANEAFFEVFERDRYVEVEAEFPWSVRNALVAFDPGLEHAKTKEEFERSFRKYIESNLILTDTDGAQMPLVEVRELGRAGHSHQSDYLLRFEGGPVAVINNTLMFNLYETQVNHVTLRFGDGTRDERATKESPSVRVAATRSGWNVVLVFVATVVGTALIACVRRRRNRESAE